MGLASSGITANHKASLFKSAPGINGQIRSFHSQIKGGLGSSALIEGKGVLSNASFEASGKGVLSAGGALSAPSLKLSGRGVLSNSGTGGIGALTLGRSNSTTGQLNFLA